MKDLHLPKAILFDADGTIYDSERLQYEATRQTARQLHDFDFTWDLYVSGMLHDSKSGHEILLEHGFDSDQEVYRRHKQELYSRMVAEQLTPLPGVRDFLKWCQQHQIICAIVSASRLMQLEVALAAVDLQDFFKILVTHEDAHDKRKPHPHPYLRALQLVGVTAAQSLAVEDTAKGITSAKRAGLRCIGIRNDINDDTELASADLIISDYQELQDYLDDTHHIS